MSNEKERLTEKPTREEPSPIEKPPRREEKVVPPIIVPPIIPDDEHPEEEWIKNIRMVGMKEY